MLAFPAMTLPFLIPSMPHCRRAIAVLCMMLCGVMPAVAVPADELSDAVAGQLAGHWQWQRLLHVPQPGRPSDIRSTDFFLSEQGRTDAVAELRATLRAYAAPWDGNPDMHARCRFPARYRWLSRHVDLPGYVRRDTRCQRFEQWARLDQLQSISVLLISGYFGNPASTFGHALIKFNSSQGAAAGLLDLSINYGALVPENEWGPVYMLRGLFGGYEAAFSDKLHYTNDLVYARTEFRDVWDYELVLDEDARELLVMHLWEVVGRKLTYYFLTDNCAYHIAELLELATGAQLLGRSSVWFIPVEMFHRLDDAQRRDNTRLVNAVRFVPSAERSLRHRLAALAPAEATATEESIAGGAARLPLTLQPLPAERASAVLDTLLAYYEYQIAAEGAAVRPAVLEAKDRVLRHRLSLPASEPVEPGIQPLMSPAAATAPMEVAMGLGHDTHGPSFVRARWAPVSYDFASFNALETGELTVMDLVADIDAHGAVRLEQLDLVRVRKLTANRMPLPEESSLSWQARIGIRREIREGDPHTDEFASFGIGRAAAWSPSLLGYAMLDAVIQSAPSRFALEPGLGVVSRHADWRASLSLGSRHDIGLRRWRGHLAAHISRRLSQHESVHLEVRREEQVSTVLSLAHHW